MGVDDLNTVFGSGRQSVRLTSKKSYTHGLITVDIAHMPGGICGAWSAFGTIGPNWPNNGGTDIIKGANSQPVNFKALHTGPGCRIANNETSSGSVSTSNGDVNAADQPEDAGCAVIAPNDKSCGTAFNEGQGAVYATEWMSEHISIWYFPHSAISSETLRDA